MFRRFTDNVKLFLKISLTFGRGYAIIEKMKGGGKMILWIDLFVVGAITFILGVLVGVLIGLANNGGEKE